MVFGFIVNPAAGGGNGARSIKVIKGILDAAEIKYKLWVTEGPGDAVTLASRAVEAGYKTVVAVGGDGTILEVANGIVNSDVCMGIIPIGSGNDYARALGLPRDIAACIDIILKRKSIVLDTVKANDEYFVNIASVGFDAEVANDAIRLKRKLPKGSVYLLSILKTLLFYKFADLSITIDGNEYSGTYLLAAVANGNYYGGGVKISPLSQMSDGVLEVCLVKKIAKPIIIAFLPLAIFGKHHIIKAVSFHSCKSVKIAYDKQMPVNIDGNIYKKNGTLNMHIVPKSIKVLV